MKFNCDYCNKENTTKPSEYRRKKRHFCDMKCYSAFMREKRNVEDHPAWQGGITPEESRKRWYAKNKKKVDAMHKARLTREMDAPGSHTAKEWEAVKAKYDYKCAEADVTCRGALTKDHIVPLAMGGSNDVANLIPLCKSHNSRKWTKASIEHLG